MAGDMATRLHAVVVACGLAGVVGFSSHTCAPGRRLTFAWRTSTIYPQSISAEASAWRTRFTPHPPGEYGEVVGAVRAAGARLAQRDDDSAAGMHAVTVCPALHKAICGLARALVVTVLILFAHGGPLQSLLNGNQAAAASVVSEPGDVLDRALSLIGDVYPGDYEALRVKRAAAAAALSSLGDPYTEFLSESDVDPLLRASALAAEAPPAGLGLAVVKDSRFPTFLTITAVFDGSPAERAGLQTGDRIQAVTGVKVTSRTSLAELAHGISENGRAGLTIQRPGLTQSIDLTVAADLAATRPPSVQLSYSRDLAARTGPSRPHTDAAKAAVDGARARPGRLVYVKLADMGAQSAGRWNSGYVLGVCVTGCVGDGMCAWCMGVTP